MKKAILIIMDGWGIGDGSKSDAINHSNTPYINSLRKNRKVAKAWLNACGTEVGLPDGQMGNSEVGHLNIGAGRVVYQDLVKINRACDDNSISKNPRLIKAFKYAKTNGKKVHFIGLIGEGGVHSSSAHLIKLCEIANDYELKDVFIHALMDGRDTDPRSGLGFMEEVLSKLINTTAKIASVCGRYYTMDRDNRWERVKKGYDLMVKGIGIGFTSPISAIKSSYERAITDEFMEASVIQGEDGKPLALIENGDVVLCFNFRTDRLREISTVLSQKDMPEFDMHKLDLHYVTMARYDESFTNVGILFENDNLTNTMGEVISALGLKQLRIAETEKYPHVTFFFSGGRELPFEGESRIMVSSPKVATYDLQPEMSANEVTQKVLMAIQTEEFDFICLNFANSDMVGHTGVYKAIRQAIETVDHCVGDVIESARIHDYTVMLTADHGNSDYAVNEDGSPNTAHSLNKVPLYFIDGIRTQIQAGRLADVAPTLLYAMEIEIPKEMTGKVLIK